MNKIIIIPLHEEYKIEDIQRVLKRYQPSLTVEKETINGITEQEYKLILEFSGLNPKKLIDLVLKAREQTSEEKTVILTPALIDAHDRIFYDATRKTILVSTGRLSPKYLTPETHEHAVLILAGIARLENDIKNPLSPDESCVLHPSKYSRHIPSTICTACRKSLPNDGALLLRSIQVMLAQREDNGQLVILIHGIRTLARWVGPVNTILRDDQFLTETFRYGYLHTIATLLHKFFLEKFSRQLYERYCHIRELNPGIDVSVIAHSFGTLVVADAITRYDDIFLDKLIVVASVINENYDWSAIVQQGRIMAVLNECAGRDLIPILAKAYVPNAGSSGTTFFSNDGHFVINNMNRAATHSSLLTGERCRQRWIPFLLNPGTADNFANRTCNPARWIEWLNRVPMFVFRLVLPVLLAGSAIWFLTDLN